MVESHLVHCNGCLKNPLLKKVFQQKSLRKKKVIGYDVEYICVLFLF